MSPRFTERQANLLAELVHLERNRCDLEPWGIPGVKAAISRVTDRDLVDVVIAFLQAARAETNRTPAVAVEVGAHWRRHPEPPQPPRHLPSTYSSTDRVSDDARRAHIERLRQINAQANRPREDTQP